MNLVLFTGDECDICHEVEEAFKNRFKEELDSGEADIINLDEDEVAQQFWAENELPLAPTIFIVSDEKKLITILDPMQLLKEASPAATSGG
ncbi:unnamed protein product [marine sediment metagenome]|uniref:Thioredoxin-like fold domain-containing protein n=1 Tax=marine sediment metagenome TaxID=412755 RepID=X1UX08_9ZZZZ